MRQLYDDRFFDVQDAAAGGEMVLLSLVVDWLRPTSLVDVGCGLGAWVRAALEKGVEDITGVDGEYVPRSLLKFPPERFVARNLLLPLNLPRRFDIAICLEVAEHLPPERGPSLIRDLCRLSDAIVFSAAIPKQGGIGHRNERWQGYWQGLFAENGYHAFDLVRPRIWSDGRVPPYYRQNSILYATGQSAAKLAEVPPEPILDCVHPDYWAGKTVTSRDMLRLMPRAMLESARYHLRSRRR